MKYKYGKEMLGAARLKLDGQNEGDTETASKIISDYTKIPYLRIKSFIMCRGLRELFDNPSLIGATGEQIKLMLEVKDLIDWGFDNTYESI